MGQLGGVVCFVSLQGLLNLDYLARLPRARPLVPLAAVLARPLEHLQVAGRIKMFTGNSNAHKLFAIGISFQSE
jgi:hypothetical protein